MLEMPTEFLFLYRLWIMSYWRLWFDQVAVKQLHTLVNILIRDMNLKFILLSENVKNINLVDKKNYFYISFLSVDPWCPLWLEIGTTTFKIPGKNFTKFTIKFSKFLVKFTKNIGLTNVTKFSI